VVEEGDETFLTRVARNCP
jgi:hypothetical protein